LFGIGGWEFMLISALALLLLGPEKLPEVARTVGRFMRDFRRYQDMMQSTIRAEIFASTSPAAAKDEAATPADAASTSLDDKIAASQARARGASTAAKAAEDAPPADEAASDDATSADETAAGDVSTTDETASEDVVPADEAVPADDVAEEVEEG
jgi:sec-independent protein translocase protein TatB